MLWLKCCPRCNSGDLYESRDMYGSYVACLQCGYYLTEAEEVALRYAITLRPTSRTKDGTRPEPVVAGCGR
jgi:hypothetical protein